MKAVLPCNQALVELDVLLNLVLLNDSRIALPILNHIHLKSFEQLRSILIRFIKFTHFMLDRHFYHSYGSTNICDCKIIVYDHLSKLLLQFWEEIDSNRHQLNSKRVDSLLINLCELCDQRVQCVYLSFSYQHYWEL